MTAAARLIVVTHPEVVVDPNQPITAWKLSARGRERAEAFAQSATMAGVSHIWCSTERKAQETAEILAALRKLPVSTEDRLGENDRSATGFLPPAAFEAAADTFFAQPDKSFRGWERAMDAQMRITRAVRQIVASHVGGDLTIVTHGAVGTLLWCKLNGCPIDRRFDQPGQGHFWQANIPPLVPLHGWQPICPPQSI